MNSDQRKSFRFQVPKGHEFAVLIVGKREVQAQILDESAGGYAVALLEDVDVQQNQVHMLKTNTGLFQTRVARIEHFADGKLLGLMRLSDLSDDEGKAPQVASWRDCLFSPQHSNGSGPGSITIGIGLAAVLGAIVCGLALCGIRYFPSRRSPEASQYTREFAEALTAEIERARDAAAEAERLAQEKSEGMKAKLAAAHSPQHARLQARVSAEVLYRLQLTSDQSRRIREILNRSSSDLSSAEAEIRSVLTTEQVQKWRSLAP